MTTASALPRRTPLFVLVLALAALAPQAAQAQLVSGLLWRNVGPFRAGRVSAVTGAIGESGVFYAGFPSGGVWKTTNAGTTWDPIFDSITTVSSIGAVEVAPSDTSVIYVGTGDFPTGANIDEGDGLYRSADAGRTWRHLGLDSTKQIPSILVDPHDPNLVLVAAQGSLHARSDARGVLRSTDGGRTWAKTLYLDDETGIQKLAWAFDRPAVIFATTDRHFFAPNEGRFGFGGAGGTGPTGTALYKSTDEGLTWHEITGGGLPRLFGRTSVAVAMHTDAQRVFLIGNFGLYRSDDGGTTWRQMDPDDRRVGNGQGGYNCGVYVSPSNPDVVYTINTSSYVSTDGGDTFTGFKGAPGGDHPAASLARSHRRPADVAGHRPGRHGLAGRRQDLEPVVQPVHGATYYPPLRRPLVPLLDLRQPTGRRRHPHARPRQLRRDHAAGLDPRRDYECGSASRTRATPTSSTGRAGERNIT